MPNRLPPSEADAATAAARCGAWWHGLAALAECLPLALLWLRMPAWSADPPGVQEIALTALALAAAFWLQVKARACANISTYSTVYRQAAQARLQLADRLAHWPMGDIARYGRASITELLTSRYAQLQDVQANVRGIIAANAMLPVLLLALLAATDIWLALLACLIMPPTFLAIAWAQRLLGQANSRMEPLRRRLADTVDELLSAAPDLRMFDPHALRLRRAVRLLRRHERAQLCAELKPARALLLFHCLLLCSLAILVAVTARHASHAAIGSLLVTLLIQLRLWRCLAELGTGLMELHHVRDTRHAIGKLADVPLLARATKPETPVHFDIRLQDLGFHHDDGSPGLRNIDGHIAQGSVLALVGPSGAGKSTLAGLLARMWDPQSGHILIGGVDIRQISHEQLNAMVAVVLQDVALFDGSVADNIRLGRPDASMGKVQQAARLACIHDRILSLPDGYDTWMDALAPCLSGGECQRLAIARALIKDAPILILDEALSNQDTDNAWAIQQAIDSLTRNRTVIVIAHNLSSIIHADQIWVMDHGTVAERGTHQSLLMQHGLYHRLWHAE